jgi:hypothetical protein
VLVALALPCMASSCSERSCDSAEDCPVGDICGRGRVCGPKECGFVLDALGGGAIEDSCLAGYRCVEGACQISTSDYLCQERPELCPEVDAGAVVDAGAEPIQDSGPAAADVSSPVDASADAG